MKQMASEQLNIGLIGYGDHCEQSHAPFLEASETCNVVGVADTNQERLIKATLRHDLTVATDDYSELLQRNDIDAVVITTGDSSHFSIARNAIEAGKHVLGEKPAAATFEELVALPGLFDTAARNGLQFWVCHPREFDNGSWQKTAQLLGDPTEISRQFGVGPMGKLLEVRHDCHYTLPGNKNELHSSFADDKLNHTIASVMRALPNIIGFRDAVLLDNGPMHYDARLIAASGFEQDEPVVIRAGGRRTAHKEHHSGKGVYRDWVEAIFEEGVLRTEPSIGSVALTYGKHELEPLRFDPEKMYTNMFGGLNESFAAAALGHEHVDALSDTTKILATAAAILMQRPESNGHISERLIRSF